MSGPKIQVLRQKLEWLKRNFPWLESKDLHAELKEWATDSGFEEDEFETFWSDYLN